LYIEHMNGHKVEYLMEQSLPHNKKYQISFICKGIWYFFALIKIYNIEEFTLINNCLPH
jgi:hypothetical protein